MPQPRLVIIGAGIDHGEEFSNRLLRGLLGGGETARLSMLALLSASPG